MLFRSVWREVLVGAPIPGDFAHLWDLNVSRGLDEPAYEIEKGAVKMERALEASLPRLTGRRYLGPNPFWGWEVNTR